jgi:uncharacterized membrane protein
MPIFFWSFILIAVIIGSFVVVALIRRQYFRQEIFPKEGFTIAELRELRDSGQMSNEEFEKARAALIGQQTDKRDIPGRSDKRPR